MALLEAQLIIKKSFIPNAGKGLFTKFSILNGERIAEFKGVVRTWKEVSNNYKNKYLFYVSRNRIIDAQRNLKCFARYANDATGCTENSKLKNNAIFVNKNGRVFIDAIQDIQPGDEILVYYGKEYWDTLRSNLTALT